MSETALKISVLRYLKELGYFVKYHSGYGGTAGIPDILGCYKGLFVAIELKYGKNKATKLQLYNIRKIQEAGGYGCVCYSVEEVKNLIKEIDNA